MARQPVSTDQAPAAIGPYSQAVRSGGLLFLSGQIPLDPATMQLVEGDIATQARRVFDNLRAVCEAAGVMANNPANTATINGVCISSPDLLEFDGLTRVNAGVLQKFRHARLPATDDPVSG